MIRNFLATLVLSILSFGAAAAPKDDIWMSVLLDGRKIGNMHTTRTVQGDRVTTTQTMSLTLERAGIKVALGTSETDEETRDGKPLAFESRTKISGTETVIHGAVKGDQIELTSTIGGATQTRSLPWPKGALLSEGLRLAEEKAGLSAGTRFSSLAFQAETLDAVEVESKVGENANVDLPGGKHALTRVEQLVKMPGAPTNTVAWIDSDFNIAKLILPVMGYDLTMLACDKACAQAPNQSADILVRGMVQAPRAISASELSSGVTFRARSTDSGEPLVFAHTDEQRVSANSGVVELRIAPLSGSDAGREGKPDPTDFRANDWLQSDAPEIVKLAAQGAGDAKTQREQMKNLETFVRAFITTKDLNVGYASALEVAKNPEGDCTEHAVLLAALGRARGIATRVVDGLAYIDSYAGGQHVFVPHAWAQAYVDGHWQSFDAALHGFDAGHIALSVGDGDPWRFFAGFNTLGRMRVDAIDPLQAAH
jgi:Transglutaminase-like superfamily